MFLLKSRSLSRGIEGSVVNSLDSMFPCLPLTSTKGALSEVKKSDSRLTVGEE